MLTIRKLNKTIFDGEQPTHLLRDISLTLEQGASLAITGDSGSGKTTLLNLIASLDKPDSGEIVLANTPVSDLSVSEADNYRRSQVGIVFQQFNLIDCFSVWDNICLPARLNQQLNRRISDQASKDHQAYLEQLLSRVNITELKHKNVMHLSGGEQQRVAIARALAAKPKLVLADEPTGNLDQANSFKVSELLFELCRAQGVAMLIVTHSQALAAQADQHLHLTQGKLQIAETIATASTAAAPA